MDASDHDPCLKPMTVGQNVLVIRLWSALCLAWIVLMTPAVVGLALSEWFTSDFLIFALLGVAALWGLLEAAGNMALSVRVPEGLALSRYLTAHTVNLGQTLRDLQGFLTVGQLRALMAIDRPNRDRHRV